MGMMKELPIIFATETCHSVFELTYGSYKNVNAYNCLNKLITINKSYKRVPDLSGTLLWALVCGAPRTVIPSHEAYPLNYFTKIKNFHDCRSFLYGG